MKGIRDERWSRLANDGYWRVCMLQCRRHHSQDDLCSCAGVAVLKRWLAYWVCLSWFYPDAASPMVKLDQQFISLCLCSLEMLGDCPDLFMLRFDKSYAFVYDDVFR